MAAPDNSRPKSGAEELAKIGAVQGLFFYLQAAGYAVSQNKKCDIRADSLLAATAAGAEHLSHLFLPLSEIAWPLSPALCALLLLYAVHLPHTLQAGSGDPLLQRMNTWFLALTFAMAMTTLGAILLMYPLESLVHQWRALPHVALYEWLFYLAVVGTWTMLAVWFICPPALRHMQRLAGTHPFAELFMGAIVAALLLFAYIGGRFDGYLDALMNICAFRK